MGKRCARMAWADALEKQRHFREKWRIALELLDVMKSQLPEYEAIIIDAGYGVVLPLLAEVEKRKEPYVAQVPSNVVAWLLNAQAALKEPKTKGRPAKHAIVNDKSVKALSMEAWREELLKSSGEWKQVRLPRADGASVRAITVSNPAYHAGQGHRQEKSKLGTYPDTGPCRPPTTPRTGLCRPRGPTRLGRFPPILVKPMAHPPQTRRRNTPLGFQRLNWRREGDSNPR